MKWKSTNIFYFIGVGLPLIVAAALSIRLAYPGKIWVIVLVAVVAALILKTVIKKTLWVPNSIDSYGEITLLELELPKEYGVDVYTSETMCKYDFIFRLAELVSPLAFRGNRPKIMVNPKMLKEEGEDFIKIAVTEQIERYRSKYQLFTTLRLVCPILLIVIAGLSIFVLNINLSVYIPGFLLSYLAPAILLGIFMLHLFLWNRSLSKKDQKIDTILATLFPMEDVKSYIKTVDRLERKGEKDNKAQVSQHYLEQRLKHLNNL